VIHVGDALTVLRTMPDESVHCIVTSPPYWGLRDYGVEGQLGLERTPEEYLARMVEVFREVRRVLRSDGTCWVNMGDSYATSMFSHNSLRTVAQPMGDWSKEGQRLPADERSKHGVTTDTTLKPKDLCGIPWRLALALQAPYYTGKIKSEADRLWLAAMIDAEGCMFIHKRKAGSDSGAKFTKADGTDVSYARTRNTYGPGLEVANTSRAIVERCLRIAGVGSICSQGPEQNGRRKQTLYRWNCRLVECRDVVREVYPFLVAKQQQARILCGCPSSGERAEAAHGALIALHRGSATDVDFPAPASLFEPGWYLRMDNIWAKLNPMPESVTDRPTKAHEYVFLLSKAARYFYDAEAIKEECESGPSDIRKMVESLPRIGGKNLASDDPMLAASSKTNAGRKRAVGDPSGRNARSVWTIATQPFPEAHFATFPEALAERCIRAGTSERGCCPECGAPWVRVVERQLVGGHRVPHARAAVYDADGEAQSGNYAAGDRLVSAHYETTATTWRPTCDHGGEPVPCTVLDPFGGAGTVGLVAAKLNRNWVLIELKPEYAAMAERRIRGALPLFAEEVAL
jgi:DNA modification methylase